MTITPVILCGGSGTRLWPMSRSAYPKQFVDWGDGRTLFSDTLQRALCVSSTEQCCVVCNEDYRFYVKSDLERCNTNARIILEPAPHNTAPAIALAAFSVKESGHDTMLVLPADHLIQNPDVFAKGVADAARIAGQGYLVTFGIIPQAPETGFGYIKQGGSLADGLGYRVQRFVEKPSRAKAQAMLNEGGYFWNSGMFVFCATVFLEELQKFAPEIYDACAAAYTAGTSDGVFFRPQAEKFASSPAESIDYAIMEKTTRAAVCPLDVVWNDLGSWEAMHQTGTKDAAGNVLVGDVVADNTRDCYVFSQHRLVATVGVQNVAVVETGDAVLVAARDKVQDVKNVVAQLVKNGRSESQFSSKVYRPWGSYETLVLAENFQVKRIIVNPGAQLSLQLHHHRSEHWVVVSGRAEVTNGDAVQMLEANQSTYIPVETKHRLYNPEETPLVLIEVQCGAYLGEDDIERFDDIYGRVTA